MRIPLHISPDDTSANANLARIALHVEAASLTGGNGFRQPSKWSKATRIERLGRASFAN